jgi:hypothetical protein
VVLFPLLVVDEQSLGLRLKFLENVHAVLTHVPASDQNHLGQLFVASLLFVVVIDAVWENVEAFCRFEGCRISVLFLVCAAISHHKSFESYLVCGAFIGLDNCVCEPRHINSCLALAY